MSRVSRNEFYYRKCTLQESRARKTSRSVGVDVTYFTPIRDTKQGDANDENLYSTSEGHKESNVQ